MRALNLMVRDGAAEKHLYRNFSALALAVVAIGDVQILQFAEVNYRLDVLDAIIVWDGNVSEDHDWKHSIFLA
jgi:hypothetical protein